MKINFFFSKAAIVGIMGNCCRFLSGRLSQNQSCHMEHSVTRVPGRGMYGLLVMSGHEQDSRYRH